MMNADLDLPTLQEAIYTALKQWHMPESGPSPLAGLLLYRQAQLTGSAGSRQISDDLVRAALDELARQHAADADLLRDRFLEDMKVYLLAKKLDIGEATLYRRQSEALQRLAETLLAQEQSARAAYQLDLEQRFGLPPAVDLIGAEPHLARLQTVLTDTGPPWLISIEGLGGLGKTALANALFRQPALLDRFAALVWVSAKQHEFFDLLHASPLPPALPAPALVDQILNLLYPDAPLPAAPPERETYLLRGLKQTPTLVVIDNLETVADFEALLPLLRQAANPSRFLLTSRHSLQLQPDLFCHSVPELERDHVHQFLRLEARRRGHSELADAADADLDQIFEVAGGNPLALKLVAGQTTRLPLPRVLDNLRQAAGDQIDKFYTYIYWQAWQLLDEASRQLLLMMPLAPPQGGSLAHLAAVSGLADQALSQAIEQLAGLSLLEVSGGLNTRRYRIHRLTETFLLTEVAKWQ